MKKSSVIFLTVAGAAATSAAMFYILHRDKVTEIEKNKDFSEKVSDFVDDAKEKIEKTTDDVKEKFEDVVEDAQEVAEHTEEIISKVVSDLKASMDYKVPPYEISHETYILPVMDDVTWKKVSVFWNEEEDKFFGIYGDEYKPFIFGDDNLEAFKEDETKNVIYIRNENLKCDYAVYKGENNG
jgi:uncharacterized protein YpuA (DUF1002 family)